MTVPVVLQCRHVVQEVTVGPASTAMLHQLEAEQLQAASSVSS